MTEPTKEPFVFNGINAATGDYLLQPMATDALIALAQGKDADELQIEAAQRHDDPASTDFLLHADADPKDIAQAGWGVIFAADEGPQIREALAPLLEHRKAQATRIEGHRYREFTGGDGYRPNERKAKFLERHEAPTSGPVDPDRMPYYLLIVGSPEKISCQFQAQLDLQYAVGRLHFDTLDEYESYARSVVASETGKVAVARRMGLFGARHDRATTLSADGLIAGLDRHVSERCPGWEVDVHVEDAATKAQLSKMLGGDQTPAVLLTASHGVGFPNGDPLQIPHQGALLCQDWQGARGRVPPAEYFSRDDLSDSARLTGLIAFIFACYGGGTPRHDAFFHRSGSRDEIAPHAFMAGLPTRMLGHPGGGALAAVAHVERAWGCSFFAKSGYQIATFESFFSQLLDGYPVGAAMEFFSSRYGELSSGLLEKLEELKYGGKVSEIEIANDWTANNDARNYVVLGDPAVRVPAADDDQVLERPRIELQGSAANASAGQSAGAPAPAPAPAPENPELGQDVDYGILDVFRGSSDETKEGSSIGESLRGFVTKFGQRVSEVLTDMSTLEVKTYVATEIEQMTLQEGEVVGAEMRAYTKISLDGDTVACLPERDGEIDEAVLEIHMRMVQQAQDARTELMKTLVQAATGLVGIGK